MDFVLLLLVKNASFDILLVFLPQRDARAAEGQLLDELITIDHQTGIKVLPHWVVQPYVRPLIDQVTGKKIDRSISASQYTDERQMPGAKEFGMFK